MSSASPTVVSLTPGHASSPDGIFSPPRDIGLLPTGFLVVVVMGFDLLAVLSGYWVRHVSKVSDPGFAFSWDGLGGRAMLLTTMLVIAVSATTGCYRLPILIRPFRGVRRVLAGAAAGGCVCALALLCGRVETADVGIVIVMLATACAMRLLCAPVIDVLARDGILRGTPVFVLGLTHELQKLTTPALLQECGLTETGRLTVTADAEPPPGLEGVARVVEHARTSGARAFVVAVSWARCQAMAPVVEALRASSLPVFLLPLERQGSIAVLGSRPELFDLRRAPIGRPWLALKRLVDIVLATLALVVLLPLMVLVAMAVRLESPGPVIFRQMRGGLDGQPFTIFKFRTMRVAQAGEPLQQARRGDERVTRVGRTLRRTSIDELPQLFNVILGDMSLVGPRPHALAHDQAFGTIAAEYTMRHRVKPGITGWAQVRKERGETVQPEQVQRRVALDLWYIQNWSPFLDVKILVRTALDIAFHDAY